MLNVRKQINISANNLLYFSLNVKEKIASFQN